MTGLSKESFPLERGSSPYIQDQNRCYPHNLASIFGNAIQMKVRKEGDISSVGGQNCKNRENVRRDLATSGHVSIQDRTHEN